MPRNIYETDALLSQYLLFHYGKKKDVFPFDFGPVDALDFHSRCVEFLIKNTSSNPEARVLDLGCAVGRSSFELAKYCQEVIGIDYSAKFIKTAKQLQKKGFIKFKKINEGLLGEMLRVKVPEGIDRRRVKFMKADACHLPKTLGTFDAVLLSNLLDRLKEPRLCLERLNFLVKPGGVVLIASPYSWLEEFTPRRHWLGGNFQNGKPQQPFATIKRIMERSFDFIKCEEFPFLFQEHKRKYQWVVSQGSLWRKKKILQERSHGHV